ncbi:MAG: tryptophan 7-halogenase [Brevundimonas sp.]|uniref:tryptophan 7-halogenase n=1 Tax=Brevundimonas sp. TaxID=1871086 RepID=UPI00391DD131
MAAKTWVIHGGGLAAWAAAVLLARDLTSDHSVVVVEDAAEDADDTVDVVLADPDGMLLQLADGAADELLAAGQAGFCLGAVWRDWRAGKDIAVAHQEPLPNIDGVAIPDLVHRAATTASDGHSYADLLAPLQFQARAMIAGRYAHPSADRQSPRSLLKPQIILGGNALATRLKAKARQLGVTAVCETDAAGLSPFMTLDTRPAAFAGDADWRTRLGHDRRLTMHIRPRRAPQPYVEMRLLVEGLATRFAMPHVEIVSLDYDSALVTTDQARRDITSLIGETDILQETDASSSPGFVRAPWRAKTLAFGLAAARFGPLMDSVCLDEQLRRLATHLPGASDQVSACAAAYNQALARDLGHRADRLHLIRLQGPGGERLAPPGPDLQRRIDLFRSRNASVALDGDPYDAQHWIMLMAGLGLQARRHDVQADRLNLSAAMGSIGRMVMAFDQTLAAMPSHEAVLNSLRRAD